VKVAFAGSFAARLAAPVRASLLFPCEVIVDDEIGIILQLVDVDVLVSMALTAHMVEAAPRLRLVQVPGAGLDRIDRGALRPDIHLAKVPWQTSQAASAPSILPHFTRSPPATNRLGVTLRRSIVCTITGV
jgi:phosphoglycerate dehydrogenase-like enzyme